MRQLSRTPRVVRPEERDQNKPIYAVWEITLKCDHSCSHCGSRAVNPRDDELSTEELLGVARALMRLGTREVTLIGGEAYLRSDVYTLIECLVQGGIRVTMQTGGRAFDEKMARQMKDAGLSAVGFSIDGMAATHNLLRNAPNSHQAVIRGIRAAIKVGLVVTANTQVNQVNRLELRTLGALLRLEGVAVWRVQMTVPMGRAADHPEWILEPFHMLDVVDTLAAIQIDAANEARAQGLEPESIFNVQASNNIGYYGPHEQILRSRPGKPDAHWRGCQAGRFTLGIESDGVVKGCPSLPTAPYAGGNVRELSLKDLWETTDAIAFTRNRTVDELWGFCKTCYYAESCMAGCSFTTHCTLGKRGNNPFCYHRATSLKKTGVRERLRRVQAAEGLPYDFGRFEIVEEPWPSDLQPQAGPHTLLTE